MLLVVSKRSTLPVTLVTGAATQYAEGGLTFDGATTIVLYPSAFPEPGAYVLFDYTGSTFDCQGYASGQAMLDALVTPYIDDTFLTNAKVSSLLDQPSSSRIVLTLVAR